MSANVLRYTLVGDGPSDRALMPILDWLFTQHSTMPFRGQPFRGQWAERVPPGKLKGRVEYAEKFFPCDILFVHRDAERESYESRLAEIEGAVREIGILYIPVIPIRMTEAWLLSSETAIRWASRNPNGQMPLGLPPIKSLETLPDPKQVLFEALKTASGLTGRRLKQFDCSYARSRVAEWTDDFSALRALSAFQHLEAAVKSTLLTLRSGSPATTSGERGKINQDG